MIEETIIITESIKNTVFSAVISKLIIRRNLIVSQDLMKTHLWSLLRQASLKNGTGM